MINADNAVYHALHNGPFFGYGPDIGITGNPIKESKLHTMKNTFNYKEDKAPFSEIEGRSLVKAMEYEVFQAIFN